ncbi:HTH-type transcriptional repressor NsrR [Hartmannibacter diazotrophicus]|uniref:HTH-type transcriptional repressor NsrR n=1 Tax=Hartmannibacter diazotrophicus TaxID=1482074 RepID=A0A2C9CZY2_9HYPH|nr:iron-responsive transcriptional regulator RirA [Hartmannibacter diazotrophicus]SON53642.1 HTH-type transcriptional repressor NsrR [Hartmannibacter diazotrophicus]
MRLTQQTNYAIRLLIYCAASEGRPAKVGDVAAAFGISELHLFKILKVLVDGGFVETLRGRKGGVLLARAASEITVGQVVRVTEENFILTDCFDEAKQDCPLISACDYNQLLHQALNAFLAVLDTKTIADLSENRPDIRFLLDLPMAAVAVN